MYTHEPHLSLAAAASYNIYNVYIGTLAAWCMYVLWLDVRLTHITLGITYRRVILLCRQQWPMIENIRTLIVLNNHKRPILFKVLTMSLILCLHGTDLYFTLETIIGMSINLNRILRSKWGVNSRSFVCGCSFT